VNALNFVANPNASRTKYASVTVNYKKVVSRVDFVAAPVPFIHDVVNAVFVCHRLQLAVVVGDANRADVCSFC